MVTGDSPRGSDGSRPPRGIFPSHPVTTISRPAPTSFFRPEAGREDRAAAARPRDRNAMRCRPGKSQRKITIGDGYCPPRPSTFVINGGQISLKQVGRAHQVEWRYLELGSKR